MNRTEKKRRIFVGVLTGCFLILNGFGAVVSEKTEVAYLESPFADELCTYHIEKFKLVVHDGVKINGKVLIPDLEIDPVDGDEKFPCVIFIHGWGGEGEDYQDVADKFAKGGYVAVLYDVRGFGNSGGKVYGISDIEIQDLKDVITFLIETEDFRVDAENIGIGGLSLGGIHSFRIAAVDQRVKTVVPIIGTYDLRQSIMPDGCLKLFYSLFLFSETLIAMTASTMMFLWAWLALTGIGLEQGVEEFEARSADLEDIRCPIYMINGWDDHLFPANLALDAYEELDPSVPKKIYLCASGHPPANEWEEEYDYIVEKMKDWFDYWLKGEPNSIMDEPPIEIAEHPWNGKTYFLEEYPIAGLNDAPLFFDRAKSERRGSLGAGPVEDQGPDKIFNTFLINGLVDDAILLYLVDWMLGGFLPGAGDLMRRLPRGTRLGSVAYLSEPFEDNRTIIGIPHVTLYLKTDSPLPIEESFDIPFPWYGDLTKIISPAEFEVVVKIYDVNPDGEETLISRGNYFAIPDETGIHKIDFDLLASYYTIVPRHRMKVTVSTSDFPFLQHSFNPFVISLYHDEEHPSSIEIPFIPLGEEGNYLTEVER